MYTTPYLTIGSNNQKEWLPYDQTLDFTVMLENYPKLIAEVLLNVSLVSLLEIKYEFLA